ncbi:MAG: hypothetical protein ACK5LO_14110 [Leucobacter sp.]
MLLSVGVFAFLHWQDIKDHFRAAAFDPSPRVVEVLDNLELSDAGERVFLASQPTIDDSQQFNAQCADVDHSEQGHVLGCFASDQIHLFDVRDERVSGIVEVTAVHELLHAVWSRLGEGEKRSLPEKLQAAYEQAAASDPTLAERMSLYEHLSDLAFANELHSVLGTEVRDLPDALEQHYARWIENRGEIVDIFDSYHALFEDLQQQADALEAELGTLRSDIEQRKAEYEEAVNTFNLDAADFTERNNRYEFSDAPEEFEAIRSDLSWRRDQLLLTYEALEDDIDHYNSLRADLIELSELSAELDQQLDSDLAPITTRPSG